MPLVERKYLNTSVDRLIRWPAINIEARLELNTDKRWNPSKTEKKRKLRPAFIVQRDNRVTTKVSV